MRVAVSRASAAGDRKGRLFDFHHTHEGEVLTLPPFVCEGREEHRVKCGCGRAFSGLSSGRACTTAIVEERPEAEVLAILQASDTVASWAALDAEGEPPIIGVFLDDLRALEMALMECEVGSLVRINSSPHQFSLEGEMRVTRRQATRATADNADKEKQMATAGDTQTQETPTVERYVYDAIRNAGEKFGELSDEQRARALDAKNHEGLRGKSLALFILDGKSLSEQQKEAKATAAAASSEETSQRRSASASTAARRKGSAYPDNIRAAVKRSNEIRGKEFGAGPKQHVHIRKVVTKELGGQDKVTKKGIVDASGASSLAQLMGLASGAEGREEMKRMQPLAAKMGDDPWCKGRHLAGALAAWTEEF